MSVSIQHDLNKIFLIVLSLLDLCCLVAIVHISCCSELPSDKCQCFDETPWLLISALDYPAISQNSEIGLTEACLPVSDRECGRALHIFTCKGPSMASSVHLPWFLFGGTLAILTIIIILLKFRSCNTRRNPRMAVIRVPPRQRAPTERHNLQTLNRANPSIKYKDVRKQSSVSSTEVSLAEICAVCLETLVDEEDVRRLTCEHVFHTRCLDSWFKEHHVDCPLCKCIFIPN